MDIKFEIYIFMLPFTSVTKTKQIITKSNWNTQQKKVKKTNQHKGYVAMALLLGYTYTKDDMGG